jgi:hypothetical protein
LIKFWGFNPEGSKMRLVIKNGVLILSAVILVLFSCKGRERKIGDPYYFKKIVCEKNSFKPIDEINADSTRLLDSYAEVFFNANGNIEKFTEYLKDSRGQLLSRWCDSKGDEIRIEGLKKIYSNTDELECRLVNNANDDLYYSYTGETTYKGRWGEIDYSLESPYKEVPIHKLKKHEMALLIWPDWRKKHLFINENNEYRFLVYFSYAGWLGEKASFKINSPSFRFMILDKKDHPPLIEGLKNTLKPDVAVTVGLQNTSPDDIEYGIGAEKWIDGQWIVVLYNLEKPYNKQNLTFIRILKGREKIVFAWPYPELKKRVSALEGKYRLFVRYALSHGEEKNVYSKEFEIAK